MNRTQKPNNREAVQRPKHWARGMEYAKKLGIEGEAELLKFCADGQGEASARGIACLALGCFEHKPAVPALLKLAEDDDLSLVVNATRALEMIGSLRALRPMISLAKRATRTEVRNRAIDVLGALGDKRAEETLVSILSDRAEAESTRVCAADALGGLRQHGDPAIACLLGVLREPSALLRWTALNTLGIMGDPSAIPAIQAYLVDQEIVPQLPSETTVASAAVNALKNLKVCAQHAS
jgi:HEAT repeat protein